MEILNGKKYGWKDSINWIKINFVFFLLMNIFFIFKGADGSTYNCPVVLTADPRVETSVFDFSFKPLIQTDIHIVDQFLTDDDEEDFICKWSVETKERHTVAISFPQFSLQKTSGSHKGDCLKIYDGNDDREPLATLCGEDIPRNQYESTGRTLYLVFERGEMHGDRRFELKYFAIDHSKEPIIKIAIVASSVIALIGLCFLTFKFTRCCRPCRKRWCKERELEDHTTHHELRPLATSPGVPRDVLNSSGDNSRNEELTLQQNMIIDPRSNVGSHEISQSLGPVFVTGGIRRAGGIIANPSPTSITPPLLMTLSQEGNPSDEIHSPSPHEPPPSYDSLFGDDNRMNTQ